MLLLITGVCWEGASDRGGEVVMVSVHAAEVEVCMYMYVYMRTCKRNSLNVVALSYQHVL